jgi:beta-glucosidase
MKYLYFLCLLFLFPVFAFSQSTESHAGTAPQLTPQDIKAVVAAMTLQEKAKFVVGLGFKIPEAIRKRIDSMSKAGHSDFHLPPSNPDADKFPDKVPGAAGRTFPIPRLGVPMMTLSDGPAGVRIDPIRNGDSSKTYYATGFPIATLLASTWDTAVVHKVGVAFGHEVHDFGVDIILAPAMNIQRNPLDGRDFEYYSEDPVIAGNMAASIVRGIQSNGVGTSVKHFVANNQETERNSINEIISERALREIYLKGFEIAVKKGHPWTIMSSYNKVNGTYTSQRRDLLTTVLRDEWGFKGFVMTDWFGGKDPVEQMNAGNDLLMPGTVLQTEAIIKAVKDGQISEKQLDLNVERILNIEVKSPAYKDYKYSSHPDLKADAEVSREAATQGMVLLKDDNDALPFKDVKTVALFGNTSYDLIANGTGSGNVNKPFTISLNQGLSNAGYVPDESLETAYQSHIEEEEANRPKNAFSFMSSFRPSELSVGADMIAQAADKDDIAVITIGRDAGEGADRKLENDFYLSQEEKNLIKNVTDAFHAKGKKVVVVLNIGGVIEVASWRDEPDAILLAWQPGEEGGNAITDILSGKVDPSGKLAQTFPMDYKDEPSADYFPGTPKDRPENVVYKEGIYVGYRYFTTFHVKTAYPFGYGLSYTHFNYGKLKLSSDHFNGKITVSETITNSGSVAGKEVAEVYISAPHKEIDKPAIELKAFGKTRLLQPGQSQTMTFTLDAADLASFYTSSSSWIAEAGTYTIKVGASCEDIRQEAKFKLAKDIVTEKDHAVLQPQQTIDELKP